MGVWLEEGQRWVGGCGRERSKRSLGIGVHGGFFVFAAFDETALVLEPIGDTGGEWRSGRSKEREEDGEDRPLISPGFEEKTRVADQSQSARVIPEKERG